MQMDSSALKYEHQLEPTVSMGPHEIVRLSPKDTDRQLKTDELEGFTVYDIPYLQEQKNGRLELVITQSCIPELQEAVGHRYDIANVVAPTEPNPSEVDVYGMHGRSDGLR